MDTGLHPREMNPITCKKIYKSMCPPRALFGCDLWTQISKNEMTMLESAHRFCLKKSTCRVFINEQDLIRFMQC